MFNMSSNPTLTDVTFSENSAEYGGGMCNEDNSSPGLTNVTFGDNSANYGGGMYNEDSDPVITNVTLGGNSANNQGGGMYNKTHLGGKGSHPILVNVIIANSRRGGDCVNDGGSSVGVGSSHNLIEDSSYACGQTDGTNGNIIGRDPVLGSLTDYGGAGKQVFPLRDGSPAIDAGVDAGCPGEDQRGVQRPQGAHCDIGSFEREAGTPLGPVEVPEPETLSLVLFGGLLAMRYLRKS